MSLLQWPGVDNERVDFKASITSNKAWTPPSNSRPPTNCSFQFDWALNINDVMVSNEYESRSIIGTLGFIGGIEQIFSAIFGYLLGAYSEFMLTLAAIKKLYEVHLGP